MEEVPILAIMLYLFSSINMFIGVCDFNGFIQSSTHINSNGEKCRDALLFKHPITFVFNDDDKFIKINNKVAFTAGYINFRISFVTINT